MYCVSTVEKRNDCIGDGFSTFFLFSHILTGPIFGELVRMVQFEGFSSSHLSTFDFQCEQPATLVDSFHQLLSGFQLCMIEIPPIHGTLSFI